MVTLNDTEQRALAKALSGDPSANAFAMNQLDHVAARSLVPTIIAALGEGDLEAKIEAAYRWISETYAGV